MLRKICQMCKCFIDSKLERASDTRGTQSGSCCGVSTLKKQIMFTVFFLISNVSIENGTIRCKQTTFEHQIGKF